MIRKAVIHKLLNEIKLTWLPDTDEYVMLEEGWPKGVKLNDDEYDAICVQGHDSSGSPGTEEQQILNAIKILGGKMPDNITNQITRPLYGWSWDRKNGVMITKQDAQRYPHPETWDSSIE